MFNADEIFLDNNATTRPLPQVQQAMNFAMNEGFGNPSSSHRGGEIARRIVTCARDDVAGLIGANPNQILFTSGATESNNWVFYSVLSSSPKPTFVTTNVEHSSVKELFENNAAIYSNLVQLRVRTDGLIDLEQVEQVCASSPTLVSIQWVNNETGVIQPIEQIAEICQSSGALLHVDGSQAVGKIPIDVSQLKIDLLTFTAHKFHGPQGIGAIYCRRPNVLKPLLYGGGQESGLRPSLRRTIVCLVINRAPPVSNGNTAFEFGTITHPRGVAHAVNQERQSDCSKLGARFHQFRSGKGFVSC